MVTSLAGGGFNGTFKDPTDAVALNGSLFFTDTLHFYVKRLDLTGSDAGVVTDVAGNGGPGFSDSSAAGGATFGAGLIGPAGMCTDGQTIYIVDQGNQSIRQMDPVTYQVTTVLGAPHSGDAGIFDSPYACTWDSATGTLYVSDQSGTAATPDGLGNVIFMVQ